MTESFYKVLKNSFDNEEQGLSNNTEVDEERMAAPDFRIIPFAKWTMPIQYTVHLIRSTVFLPLCIFTVHTVYTFYVGAELVNMVARAVNEIERRTCIRFQNVSNPDGPHIEFAEVWDLPSSVCATSPLGKESSKNTIKIASSCKVK